MSPSRPNLLALVCEACGLPLEAGEGSEVFPCRQCGRAYELAGDRLRGRVPLTAQVTSTAGRMEDARYLAVWRFAVRVAVREKRAAGIEVDDVWAAVERTAAPGPAHIYVPSFTLARVAVQQLGLALVQAQPRLVLVPGIPREQPQHQRPGAVADPALPAGGSRPGGGLARAVAEAGLADGPGFGTVSPVVFDQTDARAVAHFVYLALEADRTPDLRSIDYELHLGEAELLFVPAVYDLRHVRHSNWRFMLREYDGLVV